MRFNQEPPVHRKQLRHIHHGILRKPCRSRRQQDVARSFRQFAVTRNHRYNHRANPALVEWLGLHHQHRASIPRLRTSRFREIRPPDFAPQNLHNYLPIPIQRCQLRPVQRLVQFRRLPGIDPVQLCRNRRSIAPLQKFRQRRRVQLTPRHPQIARSFVSSAEQLVRNRYRSLHTLSINPV